MSLAKTETDFAGFGGCLKTQSLWQNGEFFDVMNSTQKSHRCTSGYMPHHSDILAPRESVAVDTTRHDIKGPQKKTLSQPHCPVEQTCNKNWITTYYTTAKIELERPLEAGLWAALQVWNQGFGAEIFKLWFNSWDFVPSNFTVDAPGLSSCPCPFLPQLWAMRCTYDTHVSTHVKHGTWRDMTVLRSLCCLTLSNLLCLQCNRRVACIPCIPGSSEGLVFSIQFCSIWARSVGLARMTPSPDRSVVFGSFPTSQDGTGAEGCSCLKTLETESERAAEENVRTQTSKLRRLCYATALRIRCHSKSKMQHFKCCCSVSLSARQYLKLHDVHM